MGGAEPVAAWDHGCMDERTYYGRCYDCGDVWREPDRLEAAAARWADTVAEAIAVRVELAVALERDRHDAELAEIREQLASLGMIVARYAVRDAAAYADAHSVKADALQARADEIAVADRAQDENEGRYSG